MENLGHPNGSAANYLPSRQPKILLLIRKGFKRVLTLGRINHSASPVSSTQTLDSPTRMESLQSIFMLTKLFGFNAYTYRKSSSKRTTESTWCRSGVTLVGLNMAANVFFSLQNANRAELNYGKSGSHLLDVGGELVLGFSYASMLAAVVLRLTRRGLMEEILNRFLLIDQRLAAVGILMDHRREARLVLGYIGLFLGVVTIAALGGLYMLYLLDSIRVGALIYGGQVFVSYSGLVLAHSCFIISQTLVRRIQLLNHHLCQDFKLRQIEPKKRSAPDNFHHQISEIAFVFDDMFKLSINLSFLLWTEVRW